VGLGLDIISYVFSFNKVIISYAMYVLISDIHYLLDF
jgi:hypothetical protein